MRTLKSLAGKFNLNGKKSIRQKFGAGSLTLVVIVAIVMLSAGTALAEPVDDANVKVRASGEAAALSDDAAVAIGPGAFASGDSTVAIGSTARAEGDASLAIGYSNTASGTGSVALGNSSTAAGEGALALGDGASASVADGVALGSKSTADREAFTEDTEAPYSGKTLNSYNTLGAVSVGTDAKKRQIINVADATEDTDAVNLRQLRGAETHYVSIMGDPADSSNADSNWDNSGASGAKYGIAIGKNAVADAPTAIHTVPEGAIAIGYNTYASGGEEFDLVGSVALGINAKAEGSGTIALGVGTQAVHTTNPDEFKMFARGRNSMAIGFQAKTYSPSAIAIGFGTTSKGRGSIAMGTEAVIGETASGSIAIGEKSEVSDRVFYGIALGYYASSKNDSAIAVGDVATASGDYSVALGKSARTDANGGTSVGSWANTKEITGVALGYNTLADRKAGIRTGTMGYDPVTGAPRERTEEEAAQEAQLKADLIAARNALQLDPHNATLMAQYSAAMAAYNKFVSTWQSVEGGVSVGNASMGTTRQITNVAAGSEDTDAVNVAQLKSASVHYVSVNDGGTQTENYGNDGAAGVNSVAVGPSAFAAGDKSMAHGSGAAAYSGKSIAAGYNAAVYYKNKVTMTDDEYNALSPEEQAKYVKAGDPSVTDTYYEVTPDQDAIAIGNFAAAKDKKASAVGYRAEASGENATALGSNTKALAIDATAAGFASQASGGGSTVMGRGATATKEYSGAFGYMSNATVDGGVALGAESAADRAAFASDTEAPFSKAVLNADNTLGAVSVGTNAKKRQIINVADATEDTDAVNLRQLRGVSESAITFEDAGGKSTDRKLGETLKVVGDPDNITTEVTEGQVAVKLNNDIKINSVTANEYKVGGATYINADGINANSKKITNVAPGQAATDAVNMSQLNTVTANIPIVKAGDNISVSRILSPNTYTVALKDTINVTSVTANTYKSGSKTFISSTGLKANYMKITGVANGTAMNDAVNYSQLQAITPHYLSVNARSHYGGPVDNYNNDGAKKPGSIAIGREALADQNNATAIGVKSKAKSQNALAIGFNNEATAMDSNAMGSRNKATGALAVAAGTKNEATGSSSSAVGYNNKTSGYASVAMGYYNEAKGSYSVATGYFSKATSNRGAALGYKAIVLSDDAVAVGGNVQASGGFSSALGVSSMASAEKSTAVGYNNYATASYATAVGAENSVAGEWRSARLQGGCTKLGTERTGLRQRNGCNGEGRSCTRLRFPRSQKRV